MFLGLDLDDKYWALSCWCFTISCWVVGYRDSIPVMFHGVLYGSQFVIPFFT